MPVRGRLFIALRFYRVCLMFLPLRLRGRRSHFAPTKTNPRIDDTIYKCPNFRKKNAKIYSMILKVFYRVRYSQARFFRSFIRRDASLYEIQPAAIVRPTSVDDVVTCVKYAAENQLSVTPRGAGTGLAGGVVE